MKKELRLADVIIIALLLLNLVSFVNTKNTAVENTDNTALVVNSPEEIQAVQIKPIEMLASFTEDSTLKLELSNSNLYLEKNQTKKEVKTLKVKKDKLKKVKPTAKYNGPDNLVYNNKKDSITRNNKKSLPKYSGPKKDDILLSIKSKEINPVDLKLNKYRKIERIPNENYLIYEGNKYSYTGVTHKKNISSKEFYAIINKNITISNKQSISCN